MLDGPWNEGSEMSNETSPFGSVACIDTVDERCIVDIPRFPNETSLAQTSVVTLTYTNNHPLLSVHSEALTRKGYWAQAH